jgi:hypothetical protein
MYHISEEGVEDIEAEAVLYVLIFPATWFNGEFPIAL